MYVTPKERIKQWDRSSLPAIEEFALNTPIITSRMIRFKFGVTGARAAYILQDMEKRGLISVYDRSVKKIRYKRVG